MHSKPRNRTYLVASDKLDFSQGHRCPSGAVEDLTRPCFKQIPRLSLPWTFERNPSGRKPRYTWKGPIAGFLCFRDASPYWLGDVPTPWDLAMGSRIAD